MIQSPSIANSLNQFSLESTQKEIQILNRQLIKNKVVLVICLVAYIAISAASIALAAFYSPPSLPLAAGMAAMGLNSFFNTFVKPRKLIISELKEKITFEKAVEKDLSKDTRRTITSTGASNFFSISKADLKPLLIRYDAYGDKARTILEKLDNFFSKAAKFDENGKAKNYKALKAICQKSGLKGADGELLEKYKAQKEKLKDDFLEARVHQIALLHLVECPFRIGKLEESYQIHRDRKIKSKDEAFVTFTNSSAHITRKELYDAHKKIARLCFNKPQTQKTFSEDKWENIRLIELKGYTLNTVHRSKDLLMLTEHKINQMFLKRFFRNDDFTLEADLRRAKEGKETSHFDNLPDTLSFTEKERGEKNPNNIDSLLRCKIRNYLRAAQSQAQAS